MKAEYNTKINQTEKKITDHDKYITNQEFNKLISDNFTARLSQAKLASKNDTAYFVKKASFDDKLKDFDKKMLQIKQNMYLLKIN